MKRYFDILRRHLRLFVLGWIALMIGLLSLRLAQGPINVDGIRPIIVSRLEAHLPGSRASIRHLDLVWFPDARAVGFRFDDLIIKDARNRIVARAGKVETALAADSLLLAHFAPARLAADDFFVAASVSKEGKYDLGYDAHGAPGSVSGLDEMLGDLTGHERLGHPLSFVRQMALGHGELHLTSEDGALDWTAHVGAIDYSKLHNRLDAHLDLTVDSQGRQAVIKGDAHGAVGLGTATISADVHNLIPAAVFPASGATAFLARVDAPLDGVARIDYGANKGFDNTWLDLRADAGHVDFGHSRQDFDGAFVRASYVSATHTIAFNTFQLKAHLIDTDLSGKVVITPEDVKAKRDLSLAYDFSGPRVTGRLADDFDPQTLTQAHLKGSYVPRLHRLTYDTLTGLLDGTPFESQGVVYTNDKGQLGADLTARIKGHFSKDEVFAFWPQHLSPITRGDLIKRIHGGDYQNADFVLKAPPGAFEPDQLQNDELRLDFDFSNLGLSIERRMQDASGLKGHGTLLGNGFSMAVTGGRLVDVALTKGALDVPSFHDHNSHTHIWLETVSPAVSVIEAVDPLADGQLARHGLNKDRMGGQASVRVDIDFPTFQNIDSHTFSVRFTGHIQDASLKQAALGWDMTQGDLTITGDLLADRLEVTGPATVGPYTGQVGYRTQFTPKTQLVTIDGHFNAAQFGGSPRVPVPIKGQFLLDHGKGQGTVDSAIFRGNVDWQGDDSHGDDRPSVVTISGVTLSDGMEGQGLPIFEHVKRELPTRIDLLRSGDIWSGEVQAEMLSGDIAYIQGQRPRLVYTSIITPDEAQQLGYGALPMFKVARHLTVNVALDAASKEALLKLDNMNATLGWSEIPGSDELRRKLTMKVQPDDWATLGLPKDFFQPAAPVDVTALWSQTDTRMDGTISLLGQDLAITMPIRHRVIAPNDPGYVAPPPPLPINGDDYDLRVSGDVSPQVLAALGYSQTPVRIDGTVGLVFSLYSTPGQPAGVLNLDATRAELGVRATDWKKPAGEQAEFAVSFDSAGPQGGLNLSRIYGAGDHVHIDGRAAFDGNGNLQFADFSNLYLKDFIDVTFKYYALAGQPASVLSLSGKQLDLRPWLDANSDATGTSDPVQTAVAAADKPAGRPTHIVVDLGNLQTAPGGAFANLKLDVNWDGRNGLDGQGTASTADGSPLALAMQSQGDYSLFSLKTDDLGDVIRTESGIANVRGGVASIEGAYRDGQIDASVRGQKARVTQLPVLAQLLTVASLQGLADTLSGEGIAFSDFDFPVRYKDHVVFIKDGWARGDALGINVWGTTDTSARTMKLNGTLIPAYGINGMFGDVRTHGLGLVGLKYDVGGTFRTPQVAVDPLSLVLPGFLKVWAQTVRKDPIPALDIPSAHDKLEKLRDQADKIEGN